MEYVYFSRQKGLKLNDFYIDALKYLYYFCKTSFGTPFSETEDRERQTDNDRICCRPKSIRESNFTEGDLFLFSEKESTPSLKCSSKVGLMPSCCPGNKALSGKQWGDWCSPIGCLCACVSVCVDVCVCVGGTGCLAVRGEEQTDERRRRRRKRRGAQRGEWVWVPKYYRSETWRQSNPSIFNASVENVHIRGAVMFVCFIQWQILTDHQFSSHCKLKRLPPPPSSYPFL